VEGLPAVVPGAQPRVDRVREVVQHPSQRRVGAEGDGRENVRLGARLQEQGRDRPSRGG
jgi:hypothetical protein